MSTNTSTLPVARYFKLALGADPELFFKRGNRVIGSELILKKKSLDTNAVLGTYDSYGQVIIDGVQVELNPKAFSCRESFASSIHQTVKALQKLMTDTKDPKLKLTLDTTVSISTTELRKLNPKNQVFGCDPSYNAYMGSEPVPPPSVDPLVFRKRSAGGHIHISLPAHMNCGSLVKSNPEKIVHLLDIIVGNTCVLMDRSKGSKERRKMYGRAGEYRLPPHGLEYRVPSNFWLHAYPLMSGVLGLTRTVTSIACMPPADFDIVYKAFREAVPEKDIVKAINTNNFELAMQNFEAVEKLIYQVQGGSSGEYALSSSVSKAFKHFVNEINTKGITTWFDHDFVTHWSNGRHATSCKGSHLGFNDYLRSVIRPILEPPAVKAVAAPIV